MPGHPLPELVRQTHRHGVADLSVFRLIPVEDLLRGVTGTPAPSCCPGAFEYEPIWECLQAGPFAYGRYAWLAIMHKVIGQGGHGDTWRLPAPGGLQALIRLLILKNLIKVFIKRIMGKESHSAKPVLALFPQE